MSALRQPDFDRYYSPAPQFTSSIVPEKQAVETLSTPRKKVIKRRSFPQQNKLPQNLKLLSAIQKASFGLALASMMASTGLYISTVKIPQLWSQEYRNLEDLQRQERELISINEKIKYQIASEAGKNRNLSISTPESAIFITPAKVNSPAQLQADASNQKAIEIKYNNLGY